MSAVGFAHTGWRSTCDSSSNTASGAAAMSIVYEYMAPPPGGPEVGPSTLSTNGPAGIRQGRSVAAGRSDGPELPVPAERGGDDLLRGALPPPEPLGDRDLALDDRVAERPEPLDLDLDHVAGLDRPGVRRRPGQKHVTRLERDRPRDVGDELVHVPEHLVGGPRLDHVAVHAG